MGTRTLGLLDLERRPGSERLARGAVVGLIAGFVGTVVMDIVLIVLFSLAGLPAVISFATIGDTASAFFSILGIELAGGFQLGALVHYIMGLILGAIFGMGVAHVKALRVDTAKKGVLLGVAYIEIVSQPILALSPILLKMGASETVLWFGACAAIHFIWGVVLGVVVSRARA